MIKILESMCSRTLLGLVLLISLGVLGCAYVLKTYYGMQPCQMCLYEQKVFMITAGVSLLGLFVPSSLRYYVTLLLGLIFLGGFLLAAYHVAIQHHWVELPAFCSSQDFSSFESVEALREQMLNTPFVRCDQVTWSLFGFSLAAYNAFLSLVLALICFKWGCCHSKKSKRK